MRRYLVGVDEAGRGPLAGPVAIGAVMVRRSFDIARLPGVRDSKQLSKEEREEWYEQLLAFRRSGRLAFAVSFASSAVIDRVGINAAVSRALARSLLRIGANPSFSEVRLDGGLFAPRAFALQRTIIRGDESEPVISLASIAAKVERDRLLERAARRYPEYGFERHKGYGTARHIGAIRTHGLCALHRNTFCGRLVA